MSLDDIDPVLTPPKRVATLGMLVNTKQVEFSFMRDHLELSDSDLSKQMSALVDAGYVLAEKTGKGASRTTWFRSSRKGEKALAAHVGALNNLILDSLPPPVPSLERRRAGQSS